MLPPDRLARFARHIVLPEVGGAGQVALAGAHIALIGCGGIGSPALQYLAAAGIGRLTLIDDDVVEASNLQRQTIFAQADIGQPKAEAAAQLFFCKFVLLLLFSSQFIRLLSPDSAGGSCLNIAFPLPILRGSQLSLRSPIEELTPCSETGLPLGFAA